MNKQQALDKVRALVPELMELSFGCHIKNGEAYIRVIKERFDGTIMIGDWNGWHSKEWAKEQFEILGHPIELHHVLLAVGRHYEGKVAEEVFNYRWINGYDLTSNAENQSEKFYTLLNEIL